MEVEGVKANQIEAHCQQHVRRVHRSHRTHRALGNGDAFQAHNQGIGVAALEENVGGIVKAVLAAAINAGAGNSE